jgi:DNA repair/transcription protein MET18/MMS19
VFIECSEEFVLGYIQVLDGERDPRNLVLAFTSVRVIVHNFHFGNAQFIDPVPETRTCRFFSGGSV